MQQRDARTLREDRARIEAAVQNSKMRRKIHIPIRKHAMKKWKIAGINFDHMHMGDNLRMSFEHPNVEVVGVCDEQPQRMESTIKRFNIPPDRVFSDYRQCLEKTKPDLVLLCPATARHGEWTEKV